ncbi:hypothetical protein TrRE_jg6267 [Triparma retinervis]|uniref:Band 7 domain-containing protein n=1 Tax=Triparma retinervis TaxID=2557542 RepID=A0A9W7FWC0_9STRA|nr:hypothetical protein TrRE_jg6267 [Triparma retinervis]
MQGLLNPPAASVCCLTCVRTRNVAIVENLGNFQSLLDPGAHCLFFPCAQVQGTLSLRVQQLDVNVETKTKDNVFVNVSVSVQYCVIPERAYDAYYRLTNVSSQVSSYVFDVVRSTVPRIDLDDVFIQKAQIAESVMNQLRSEMTGYGYEILDTLVVDIDPDRKVKNSMNEINASKRLRQAAHFKADADKIKQVKAAEAEAESRYLSGKGVARQRAAIVNGLKESVNDFRSDVKGTTASDVMDLLLLTQYFDLLKDVGCNTIFMNHSPDEVANLKGQVNQTVMATKSKGSASFF